MQTGELIKAMRMQAAFEDIRKHHGVINRRDGNTVARQHFHVVFNILPDLENG